MDALLDPFRGGIGTRALIEVLLLAIACGPLGVWVVLYGQSYAAESMSHGMLPGLVVAALAGAPLLLGGLAGVLLAAAVIALLSREERLAGDVAVAVAVTALVGLGGLLALAPDAPPRLQELLFGDLLAVTAGDLVAAAALAGALVVALAAGHRRLVLGTFDAPAARSLGAPPARSLALLLVLLAVAVLTAVQGLGSLLVVALVLAPAAAALNLARRLAPALAVAAALAAASGVGGLQLSYHLEIAAGAAVTLCAVALFALSLPLARARQA